MIIKKLLLRTVVLLAINITEQRETPQQRIIQGWDAYPGQFPWHVSIQESEDNEPFQHGCGGTLISNRHVLTAGHCSKYAYVQSTDAGIFINRQSNHGYSADYSGTRVVAGAHNVTDRNEAFRQEMEICNVKLHPKLNITTHTAITKGYSSSDFAILTLRKSVTFTERAQPIRLAPLNANPINQTCLFAGWGILKKVEPPPYPDVLQCMNVTIISNQECQTYFDGGVSGYILGPDIICGIDQKKEKLPTGAGDNDSGGGLICFDGDGPYLAGVLSLGTYVDKPGAHAVSAFCQTSQAMEFIACAPMKII